MRVIQELIDHLSQRGALSLNEIAYLRREGYGRDSLDALAVDRLNLSGRTLQGLWLGGAATIGELLRTPGERLFASGALDIAGYRELRAALIEADLFDEEDALHHVPQMHTVTPVSGGDAGGSAAELWEEHYDRVSSRSPQRGEWRWSGRRVPRRTR